MFLTLETLRISALLLSPVIPRASAELLQVSSASLIQPSFNPHLAPPAELLQAPAYKHQLPLTFKHQLPPSAEPLQARVQAPTAAHIQTPTATHTRPPPSCSRPSAPKPRAATTSSGRRRWSRTRPPLGRRWPSRGRGAGWCCSRGRKEMRSVRTWCCQPAAAASLATTEKHIRSIMH